MKRNKLLCLLSVLLVVANQNVAMAQTRYVQKTVDITMPTVLDLEMMSGANPIANFDQTNKIDVGIELLNQTVIKYRSNKSWFVTINANSSVFSGGLPGSPMPVSVIRYRLNSSGDSYIPLALGSQPLYASSASKYIRGTGSFGIDFFIDPGYIYAPAQDYTLQVIYTISNL